MTYYTLSITKTSKPAGRPPKGVDFFDQWSTYDRDEKKFKTLEEVKAYLIKEYGHCKRTNFYRDTDDGAQVSGKVYSFSTGWGGEHWHEQHWVEVAKVTGRICII